jgi:hypothetical protein
MLLKNTFKLVIAAFVLLAISYVVYNIYEIYAVGQEDANTKNFIEGIVTKIDKLEDGQSKSFIMRGVENKYLVGWNKLDENRPDKCFFESCLCICPNADSDSCQNLGICREFADGKDLDIQSFVSKVVFEVPSESNIKIIPLSSFSFLAINETLSCVKLSSTNLIELKVTKNSTSISIFYDSNEDWGDLGNRNDGCFSS